eukprot:1449743-Prymnesium_polylepis.1
MGRGHRVPDAARRLPSVAPPSAAPPSAAPPARTAPPSAAPPGATHLKGTTIVGWHSDDMPVCGTSSA